MATSQPWAAQAAHQREIGRGLPVFLFLVFTAIIWFSGRTLADPSWLDQALTNASAVRDRGAALWDLIPPVSDPRLIGSSLLLSVGLPVSLTLLCVRLTSILIGAATVFILARNSGEQGRFDRAAAWFLAVSPLWVEGAAAGDPALSLGLVFLLLLRFRLRFWIRIALVGWACGWSSWAWITLPLLLLNNRGENRRFSGEHLAAVALTLPLILILNPLALFSPSLWWEGMIHQITSDGFWSAGAHIGTASSLWPLVSTIHYSGMALLLIAAYYWPQRLRCLEAPPMIFLLVLALGARSAYADGTMLLMLLPWACLEIGSGWNRLRPLLIGKIKHVGVGLVLLVLLVPATIATLAIAPPPVQVLDQQVQTAEWLELNLPAGALVVHDMSFAAPDETDLVYLALPFHAISPQLHRGAYWRGWYPMASAYVISERMIIRLLKAPDKSAEILDFFQALTLEALSDIAFGSEVERRTRVLLVTPPAEIELGEGWRRRLAAGPHGGIDGGWLATLGLAYLKTGQTPLAAQLLEEALTAGYRDLGIYINLANAFSAIGRTNEAGRVLDEGHLIYPDSPEMLYNLGVILVKGERWNRAVQTLARLQQHWPESAEVALMLGLSMINDEHPLNAAVLLNKALSLNPTPEQREEIERLLRYLESREP